MRATICPQGSGFSMISKVKENYRGRSWISVYNVFVIRFAMDEEENDEELERFLKQNLLRGFFWSVLLKTHKSSSHPTAKCMHTSFILTLSSHVHTHSPLSAANTANSADLLKVNLPYNYHPSSKPAIPNSLALPHMPTQWNKIPPPSSHPSGQSIQSSSALPSLAVRSLSRQRPGSGSCRRRQWPRSFCQRRQCREACRGPSRTHPMAHSCQGHKSHRQWSGAAEKKRISQ